MACGNTTLCSPNDATPYSPCDIKCYLCKKIYKDPRKLACEHSFCILCLQPLMEQRIACVARQEVKNKSENFKRYIQCSQCLEKTKLGRKSLHGLPRDIQLQEFVTARFQRFHQGAPCSLCEDEPQAAVVTCRDCARTNYCEECLRLYHPCRIRKTLESLTSRDDFSDPSMERAICNWATC